MSAGAQAEALATGTTTARMFLEAHLEKIAAREAEIGAFWHIDEQDARRAADDADMRRKAGRALSRFDGIAVAIKDNIAVRGRPFTAGLAAYRGRIASEDAPLVRKLRAAGLAILGKTAMDEGALGASGRTPGFGICQNPLRAGYTPGGSSGGSAAAVAAGFVPWAIGTDTMGSVRLPAAYCGVVGLKPSPGIVSRTGVVPLSTTLDTVGTITNHARDAAELVRLAAGFDTADVHSVQMPDGWGDMRRRPVSGLRLGLPKQAMAMDMEPAVMAAFDRARQSLSRGGIQLTVVDLDGWDPGAARRAGLLLAEAEAATQHGALIDDPAAATPTYRAALAYGRDAPSGRLIAALDRLAIVRTALRRTLRDFDALVLPTAPQVAFAHDRLPPANQADFTALANIAGLPAIAVPVPGDDLPSSVQFVGRPFDEATLVALADALIGSKSAAAALR